MAAPVPKQSRIRLLGSSIGHLEDLRSCYVLRYRVIGNSSCAGPYSGTKFAVRAICEGLRQEVKEYNIRTTILCPGAVKTELLDHISDEAVKAANSDYVNQVGIPADSYARIAAFAISQPDEVDVNEIIFRPTAQQL
jgi:NADP-dependent 3-hydroxy acid dehydrogenase YdfG